MRYQVLLQNYGQSGLWKNRKINIKKKEKGKNMKYTADTKPGMGDPYWYEWSVGQKYIIDMLNPDNEIKHVELQADVALGLDDVVITYMDGHKKFVQVKHTRANDTLTFGDLVTIDTSNVDANSHISLLGELAKSWNEEHSKYSTTDILLFSNRKKGKRIAHAGPQRSIKRPALNWFIDDLSKQLETVKKYNELVFPGYELAWEEWKKQLEYIPNDDKKLEFLKHLSISTDQEELEALGETLIEKLKNTFKTNDEIARLLFVRLDHALRKWTTSIRDSSIVSVEDVLRELSIEDDIISYNHDLIPSVPFFESRLSVVEDIEKALSCPQNRVVFLSGIPGTGKTNIISKLSGKRNSIVNIRYYAYEPIDPQKEYLPKDVSRRVDNSVFWNELFNQLRRQLLGKLSKYRVPVINNLLPQEQLRSEFFRIAAEYAQDENSLFIVAIDGIDHAARANVSENTFLSALPNPEYLPENVKIVIAGQPKEDYRNYPEWLFNNEMGYVKEIHVPSILKSDIYSLVENKFPEMDNVFKNQLTNVVCRYADGNTLSAIFAVHEATQCNDIVALEQRLTDRKLSGNIQEYYKAIWDSAKAKFQIPFVDYKMAGVFAFFNEPLNEYKLQKIFSEEGISISVWRNVLKSMRPLLVETNGNYTILHNDIRVYLSRIIGRDNDWIEEVYSFLASYYINLSEEEKGYSYYNDVLRFLIYAKRASEFKNIFTPDFIISSFVYGIGINEIYSRANDFLKRTIDENVIDWEQMKCLAFGYLTIDQIEKSQNEIEGANFRTTNQYIPVNSYECYVKPLASWNSEIITSVLSLASDLIDNNHADRAEALLYNWFYDVTLEQIYDCVKVNDGNDDGWLSPEYRNIGNLIGKTACATQSTFLLKNLSELCEKSRSFTGAVCDSAMRSAFKYLVGNDLYSTLADIELILLDTLVEEIKLLLSSNRINDLRQTEIIFREKLQKKPAGLLISLFVQIITDNICFSIEQHKSFLEQINTIELPNTMVENLMSYYSMLAVVSAYLSESALSSEVANEIAERYLADHTHYKRNYFILYFNVLCYGAKWFYQKENGKTSIVDLSGLKVMLENLFLKDWNIQDRDFETPRLLPYILRAVIVLATNENDDKTKEVVFDICERIFADNPVNSFFETGIFFYRNNPKRIQEWYDDWLSENGKLWQEPLYDRNAILKRFIDAKKIYDLNNDIYMELALTKSSWSVIGYVSHKEYSGDFLLNWYNALVDLDEANIHRFAREIKDISDKIELLGDNRMRHHIDSKIFSDVFSEGIKDIISFLKNEYYFSQAMKSPYYLVDGLTGYLRKNNPNREQLLLIWTTGMVLLDWRLEDNHSSIAALQKAIEICALRNGYCDIHSDLSLLGPAYINLMGEPVKYIIPDRWVDNTSFSEETTSVEYYEQMIHEYVQDKSYSSTAILEACESLHNKDALKESVVLEIMEHEFFKESSSIERNSLLEYLISFGKAEETDVLIRKYLGMLLQRDHYYCALDVPALVLWKMKQLSPEYGINGMKQILDMHRSWRTAAGHIKDVELTNEIIFTKLVDWNESTDLYTLFLDIALLLIKSEDADAARTALAGVFATLRVEPDYINFIEKMWDSFHYRAKEWILMIYELLWDYREDFHDNMLTILKKHCEDEDFNVSLYSNLLLENYSSDDSFKYIRNSKSYFDEIPNRGHKLFIKKNRPSPWINGYDCVMEQIELLSERLEVDGEHLEKRVADYCDKIPDTVQLIKLGRKWWGCRVVCENPNRSFLRVLYKDWYNHKFDWEEAELGRIVLSASEPYCLLITPQLWTYNNGYLLNPPESFISSSSVEQKKQIHDILFEGVDDTETVLAGGIIDYTHKEEIFGFMVSYFSIPGLPSKYAAYCYERNSRLLLQSRPDFSEQEHYNITLHHNGIESFQGSNIMCGFSKISLDEFHWHINITVNGMRLFNEGGQEIGRFEYYYGQRGNMGNRYISNQPLLQRWVVSNDAVSKARCIVGCPNNIKINHAFDSVIRKYED